MVAVGLARSVPLIAVSTIILGFFTDLYRPAVSAAITDLVPSSDRPRAFGYLYWAINIGAAIAPVAAGFLARTNYLLLFVGDALTTLAFGLIVLWGVRETRPAELEGRLSQPVGERLRALRAEPVLLAFTGLALVFGTIYAQAHVTLPVAMSSNGLTPTQYGLAIALNGALIVVLGLPASNAAPRWPRFGALAIAALLLGIGFGLPAVVTTFAGYGLSVGIWTLGEIIAATVAPSVVADLAPIDKRGLYQGVFGAAWGLAFLTGPVLGGWIYQTRGATVLWGTCLLAGVLLFAGYLALGRVARRRMALVR
jgi:MFS family permease